MEELHLENFPEVEKSAVYVSIRLIDKINGFLIPVKFIEK